jgi:putative CocE/NonD family hydrolase
MVRIVEEFPYAAREIPNAWITLASGERLAARIWLPEVKAQERLPAVMEFSVYRKSDVQAVRDSAAYGYLAGHGYACVRVECRGTGDSDGLQTDQFSTAYIDDAIESLAWIAEQDWCDGQVAMIGLSWPGHMCLQVAARRPPQLAAIVPMDAADDRYTNKYHGGCLLHYAFSISAALLGMHARPPHPGHVGERWRTMWQARVENAVVCLEHWIAHPTRDGYWADGSVIDRYVDMKVPMFASCGLADPGYAVCTPRMLEHYGGPRRMLLGPWAHRMPHFAIPGPGVDFLADVRGWLDRWMKGGPAEAPDAPDLRAWIYEREWPPRDHAMHRFAICADGLAARPAAESVVEVSSPLTVGAYGGEWMPWFVATNGPELAGDQRADDALSACFDSAPLDAAIDVFGQVRVVLDVAADQVEAQIALRLCSVAPDGSSRRIAFGFLDLAMRDSDTHRLAVEPAERYRIAVDLLPASHHVPAGHRLRLAVSTSYWPMIWPARRRVRLSLFVGAGELSVPVRPRRAEDANVETLAEPALSAGIPATVLRKPSARRSLTQDLATGTTRLLIEEDGGHARIEDRCIEIEWTGSRSTSIKPDDPLSAAAQAHWSWILRFDQVETRTRASTRLTCTADTFEIEAHVEAHEGERLIADKTIRRSLRRPGA